MKWASEQWNEEQNEGTGTGERQENERWELGERTHGASQANRGPFLLSHFFYLLLTLSHTNTVSGERWERSEEEERERGEQREVNKVNQMNVACASLHSLTHCSFISSLYYVLFVHCSFTNNNTLGVWRWGSERTHEQGQGNDTAEPGTQPMLLVLFILSTFGSFITVTSP